MGSYETHIEKLESLPPRQREVTKLILAGHTAKSIAFELGLSVYTVREHLETVYRKFDVGGRDELMARFISQSHPGAEDPLRTAPNGGLQ
jgi:DNA-binding CsgD family transcriptional regulator